VFRPPALWQRGDALPAKIGRQNPPCGTGKFLRPRRRFLPAATRPGRSCAGWC